MANEFFPYYFQDNGISMKIDSIEVDGHPSPEVVFSDIATVDLTAKSSWKNIRVGVAVQIDPRAAELVLPASERDSKPWHVVLVATSTMNSTRQIGWRQREQLAPNSGDGFAWGGSILFYSDDVGAAIRLRAYLTRERMPSASETGYADEPGLRLGASEEWTIQIDPRSIPPGKAMKIEYINFRTCPRENLNRIADSLYFLDLNQDFPILYLNEAIPDLKTVLNSPGYVGHKAAIRDAVFHSIAQPVWVALALAASAKVAEDENERPVWQRSVLRHIAPRAYPDENEEDAVKHMVREGSQPDSQAILLQRILPAIQEYVNLQKSTLRLFRETLSNL